MKIFIDNKQFEVNPQKTVLQILKENGFYIPYYCFHPNLRITASCRVCIVEIEIKGKRFLVTSCSTYPQEEMKIFPYSEKSKEARANILEFMLIHHPIDCPLCEKGGKCDLQDFTYKFGRSFPFSNYKKILPPKQKLNGLLRFYETRCILCYRCSNFWREEVYSDEWLSFKRGKESFVGPFERELKDDVPFLGYLTHICPVGAILDDKDYRFGPRPWDLYEIESSCILCSTGCELKFWVKNPRREKVLKSGIKKKPDKIYKVIAKDDFENPTIFCDRIFYGKDFISNEKRIFKGLILEEFKDKLKKVLKSFDPDEICFFISPRETDSVLKKIKNFLLKNKLKNIVILPSEIHRGAEKILSDVNYIDFENSFTLIYYSLLDYSHPVIGLELFRIMKEGKRRKKVKFFFFGNRERKNNFFMVLSGFEDRFFKNADLSLKMELKKSYEFLLDLLTLFYREKGEIPEIKDFKFLNKFFFEEEIKKRKLFFQESKEIFEKIKKYENFILVFNDMLPPKIQVLFYLLSKFHEKSKILNLRALFNTEGFLRIFNGIEFKSLKEIKEKIEKKEIKCLIFYRIEPFYEIKDDDFLNSLKELVVFYINSLKPKEDNNFYSLFIQTPFEYGGEFINNLGEKRKIAKIFDSLFDAYDPSNLFDEEEIEVEIPFQNKLDLTYFLKNDIEEIEFLVEKPNLWDINLLFSENINRDFEIENLKPIVKLKRLFYK
ncbi:MAG: 2Fe-2S iron-sulfur cluster-binding protein [candidate division WOR-3 bacterium]